MSVVVLAQMKMYPPTQSRMMLSEVRLSDPLYGTMNFMRRLALASLLLGLSPALAHADTLIGTVVGVTDGDTITVLEPTEKKPHKIRLTGIDAPEKRQAFGEVAKLRLSDLIFTKRVRV